MHSAQDPFHTWFKSTLKLTRTYNKLTIFSPCEGETDGSQTSTHDQRQQDHKYTEYTNLRVKLTSWRFAYLSVDHPAHT